MHSVNVWKGCHRVAGSDLAELAVNDLKGVDNKSFNHILHWEHPHVIVVIIFSSLEHTYTDKNLTR